MGGSRFEMDDVEAVIPLEVRRDGRVNGLSSYVGQKVYVVVPKPGLRKGRGRKLLKGGGD